MTICRQQRAVPGALFVRYGLLMLLICFEVQPVCAHEFWLEPASYSVDESQQIQVMIRNGQDFTGEIIPFVPGAFRRFTITDAGTTTSITGKRGAIPAVTQLAAKNGLQVLRYESVYHFVAYDSFEEFVQFVTEEGASWVLDEHSRQRLPTESVTEIYSRYAKTLINVGSPTGRDVPLGMELELVASTNPYRTSGSSDIKIQLFYRGNPLPNAQVSVFTKQSDRQRDSVQRLTYRTDNNGQLVIAGVPETDYLVNAVHLRQPGMLQRVGALSNSRRAHWESLWASLTFSTRPEHADDLDIL